MAKSLARIRALASVVAGVMRSTMPLGNATLSRTQAARPLVEIVRQPGDGIAGDDAVVGDVVARHDGERRDARRLAARQPGQHQAERGLRQPAFGHRPASATMSALSGSNLCVAGSM